MKESQGILALLFEIIEEISDPIFQERVWVNGEGPECSSFDEAICGFFDDAQAGYIIDNSTQFRLSKDQLNCLIELFDALSDFSKNTPNNLSDAEIVYDPKWLQIQKVAKRTMTTLRDHPLLKIQDR